ncbi:MAG: GntR family transcriptional regulator [Humibacillus sp.]|nr:GntR family transcriptional regulator [Humibacillus sp.]MDN5776360.1 GntR family transcriptional regulator [Humibacillus sp.]
MDSHLDAATPGASDGPVAAIADATDSGRAADRAYTAIRHQILTGERDGGEWLRETDLSMALGVSRTPVREALRRLAAEGLVSHERNRGVRVQNWSSHDLDEIFSLRTVLEPWGSALAAERGVADTDELDDLANRMDRAASGPTPDVELITPLNNRFHRLILEASGNSRLVTLVASVVDVPLVSRTFSRYGPESLRRSVAHHHEIVSALRAHDPIWAESVMRSHVRSAWAALRADDSIAQD